jgi:RsiW-degrading membrane proteinase PrsW (M82 family)
VTCVSCGATREGDTLVCTSCGHPAARVAEPAPSLLRDFVSVSLKEAVLVDKITRSQILRSPVFLFLGLVAIVPLIIQLLRTNDQVLYGLAVWSGVLWALVLYRLFSDRDLPFAWALGALLFTAFVAFPMLEVYVWLPPQPSKWLTSRESMLLRFIGFSFGVGVREEMFKAVPLFALAVLSPRIRNPVNGLVLGMMSGVGFAVAENVYYVFQTLDRALSAVRETGSLGYLIVPIYNNVVRMAMTPFLHGCFTGIFGYFVALAAADRKRRPAFLAVGLILSSTLHGSYDTFVGWSPVCGVLVEGAAFFLLMTYVLKARGLASAREIGGGVFNRTVLGRRSANDRTPLATPPPPESALPPATIRLVSASGGWQLRGVAGPADGQTFLLQGAEVRLGRDPERCAVHLTEPTISREHATLDRDDAGAWRLRRLSLSSPVFLNGAAVTEAALRAGDRLQVGSSVLVLESLA